MHRPLIPITGLALALAASIATAVPALAECGLQTNEFPPYTEVAPTARRVIIGTVVENLTEHAGTVSSFMFRVDEVLRGEAPATLQVTDLKSNLPLEGSPACRGDAKIYARIGDVLAVALGGKYAGEEAVNTAAWIEGRPKEDRISGAQVLSLAQARRAAADLPPTDTATISQGDVGDSPQVWPIAVLVALIAGVMVTWRRWARQAA